MVMNYIKCTFSIEPFNSDFADVLAAYLGDCGFESFETTEMAFRITSYNVCYTKLLRLS